MDVGIRIRQSREALKENQKSFAMLLEVTQGSLSKIESGKQVPSLDLLGKIFSMGISPTWLLTGEGPMFLAETPSDSSNFQTLGNSPDASNVRAHAHLPESSPNLRRSQIFRNHPQTCDVRKSSGIAPKLATFPNLDESSYEIPLLSKEEMLHYNLRKEIPTPRAKTGEYPPHMTVAVPLWLQEYSTDLRAVRVFNSRMAPRLVSNDIAIIQATGWNGDGIYLYRLDGNLHISYVAFFEEWGFQIRHEFKPSEVSHTHNLEPLGIVRAVIRRSEDLVGAYSGNPYQKEPPRIEEVREDGPGYGAVELEPVPYVSGVAAGEPSEVFFHYEFYWLEKKMLKGSGKNYAVMGVAGTSMTKADIHDGDVALIHRDKDLLSGGIYLVRHEGEYTLKRYIKDDEGQEWLAYDDGSGRRVNVQPGDWEVIGSFCMAFRPDEGRIRGVG